MENTVDALKYLAGDKIKTTMCQGLIFLIHILKFINFFKHIEVAIINLFS